MHSYIDTAWDVTVEIEWLLKFTDLFRIQPFREKLSRVLLHVLVCKSPKECINTYIYIAKCYVCKSEVVSLSTLAKYS